MKVKYLVGALVILVIINVATLATFTVLHIQNQRNVGPGPFVGQRMAAERFGRNGPPGEMLSHRERHELRELLMDFREETRPMHDRLREIEQQAIALLREDPVPRAEVDSLLGEVAQTRLEIARAATDRMIEAKSVLSPGQQEFFFRAIVVAQPVPGDAPRPFREKGRSRRPSR